MKSEPKDFMKVFLDLKNQIWDDCTKFTGISKKDESWKGWLIQG